MQLRFIMPFKFSKEYKREYSKKYNKRTNYAAQKKWNLKNKEKIRQSRKEDYLKNNEKRLRISKEWRLKNKEKSLRSSREYYLKNKEKIKETRRKWNLKNKKEKNEISKKYYYEHKEKINKRRVRQMKHQYHTDLNFRLRRCLAQRIIDAVKGRNKSASTMKLIGCTIEELWRHLESKFEPWMTRQNHGLWHVDHIIPCFSFDLTDPEQQRECFHYTNLQPLEAIANIKKGKKIISGDITSPKM